MSTNGLGTAAVGTVWRTLSGSLALITGRVSATNLENGIRDKYSERLNGSHRFSCAPEMPGGSQYIPKRLVVSAEAREY